MSIGERIRARRIELGLSLQDVGRALGVNRSTVKRYEDGKIRRIPQDTVEMLSVTLKTTPASLMGWEAQDDTDGPQLDGEVLLLARQMQNLPAQKRTLLKNIVKSMSEIADETYDSTDGETKK